MHLLAIDLSNFIFDLPHISGQLALCLCHGLVLLHATAPLLCYPFQIMRSLSPPHVYFIFPSHPQEVLKSPHLCSTCTMSNHLCTYSYALRLWKSLTDQEKLVTMNCILFIFLTLGLR